MKVETNLQEKVKACNKSSFYATDRDINMINRIAYRKTKRFFWILLNLILLLPIIHYAIFPQQTNCILIRFSKLQQDGMLFYRKEVQPKKIDSVKHILHQAMLRIDSFWQTRTCNPVFIYCDTDEDFKTFGSNYGVPAVTHLKLGEYIVISHDGIDLDILSHEITHAELYHRIGFYNHQFKIPTWFDEGLAMQVDYRYYYSEDTLSAKTNHYQTMPDVTTMSTGKQFQSGTLEDVMLHYMASKHIIHQWYTHEKLATFINKINISKSFAAAYKQ